MKKILIALIVFLAACSVKPTDLEVVSDFELNKYLGTWYEIARLPNRFEKDLIKVSANYSLKDDGGVAVLNRGYNAKTEEWEEAQGKAYFTMSPDVGALKVSFFGPFYGGYNVIELDHDSYQYAMVAGPKRDYLWILSRTKQLDDTVTKRLVNKAQKYGFDVSKLEWVEQN
ncbi:MAG: lipocalin family protein [Gammaproteobacteria bacterium]|nr:lipocalin family protein [Gammaproteobacteria bacterium]